MRIQQEDLVQPQDTEDNRQDQATARGQDTDAFKI